MSPETHDTAGLFYVILIGAWFIFLGYIFVFRAEDFARWQMRLILRPLEAFGITLDDFPKTKRGERVRRLLQGKEGFTRFERWVVGLAGFLLLTVGLCLVVSLVLHLLAQWTVTEDFWWTVTENTWIMERVR